MKQPLTHKGHKEVKGIRFSPAGNGLISHTEQWTHRGGQGGGPSYDVHDLPMIHKSMGHAVKHLKANFSHLFGQQPVPEGEPKPEMPAPPMSGVMAAPDGDD